MRILLLFILTFVIVSCQSVLEPEKEVLFTIEENNNLHVDYTGKDTLKLTLDWLTTDSIMAKDSSVIKLSKFINDGHRTEAAYRYAKDSELNVIVSAYNKGVFLKDSIIALNIPEINPDLLSEYAILYNGTLCPYITNIPNPNNKAYIRGWLYDNEHRLDSVQFDVMSDVLFRFAMPNQLIYKLDKSVKIPVFTKFPSETFTVESNLKADNYYFVAVQSEEGLKRSVKDIIQKEKKSNLIVSDTIFRGKCLDYREEYGGNLISIFLLGINEDWSDRAIPVGVFALDEEGPYISTYSLSPSSLRPLHNGSLVDIIGDDSFDRPGTLAFNTKKYGYTISDKYRVDTYGDVKVSYGNFQGNDYFGYDIPFNIRIRGDVKEVSIGNHKLKREQLLNNSSITLHFKRLNYGNNNFKVTAVDNRGNSETGSININVQPVRRSNNSYDDDYDDLDSRISDIESRLDELDD